MIWEVVFVVFSVVFGVFFVEVVDEVCCCGIWIIGIVIMVVEVFVFVEVGVDVVVVIGVEVGGYWVFFLCLVEELLVGIFFFIL